MVLRPRKYFHNVLLFVRQGACHWAFAARRNLELRTPPIAFYGWVMFAEPQQVHLPPPIMAFRLLQKIFISFTPPSTTETPSIADYMAQTGTAQALRHD